MSEASLPTTGYGLSWALTEGRDLITKTLAPSFVFVDFETFVNTNVVHRLEKRGISAYVSINGPVGLLASVCGWDAALSAVSHGVDDAAAKRAFEYISNAISQAADSGATAVVLCDDLCGINMPLVDPRFVVEHLLPFYERFAAKAAEVGTPAIFHAEGDVREYYAALAADGFAGVHIAHPTFEATEELFDAAREVGLRPLGGIVTARFDEDGLDKVADFALKMANSGDALICDDGALLSQGHIAQIVEVMRRIRADAV